MTAYRECSHSTAVASYAGTCAVHSEHHPVCACICRACIRAILHQGQGARVLCLCAHCLSEQGLLRLFLVSIVALQPHDRRRRRGGRRRSGRRRSRRRRTSSSRGPCASPFSSRELPPLRRPSRRLTSARCRQAGRTPSTRSSLRSANPNPRSLALALALALTLNPNPNVTLSSLTLALTLTPQPPNPSPNPNPHPNPSTPQPQPLPQP